MPILALIFVAVPSTAVSLLLARFQLAGPDGRPLGTTALMLLLLTAFPLMALLVWAWLRHVEKRPLATIGLVGGERLRRFLRGHAIGLASVLLVVGAIWLAGGYRAGAVLPAFGSVAALGSAALLLAGFALQSSVEEIVFRGWLLSGIARKLNLPLAVTLTSIVFALLHYAPGQHPLAPIGTFVISVFACCWALKAGHIWGVMGWHAGWNWLLAAGFELPLSGTPPIEPALLVQLVDLGPQPLTGGAYGPEASWPGLVGFIAASAMLVGPPAALRAPG